MNKNFYIVIEIEEDKKLYSHIVKATKNDNLLSKLKINGIKTATICETKKQAEAITKFLNKTYQINNVYMFDEIKF
jgi:hypothetical protein